MSASRSHISHDDLAVAGYAACTAFVIAVLPVLLIALLGWVTTLDFYLSCSAVFALVVYAEEGEL